MTALAVLVSAHADTITANDLAARYERRRADLAARYGPASTQVRDLAGRYLGLIERASSPAPAEADLDEGAPDLDLTAVLDAVEAIR